MEIFTYALLKKYTNEIVKDLEQSIQGKSAYEIAVDHGFQGTEAEWVISLQGDSPHIGENGHWFIGNVDTGVPAKPNLDGYYSENNLVAMTKEEILEICK